MFNSPFPYNCFIAYLSNIGFYRISNYLFYYYYFLCTCNGVSNYNISIAYHTEKLLLLVIFKIIVTLITIKGIYIVKLTNGWVVLVLNSLIKMAVYVSVVLLCALPLVFGAVDFWNYKCVYDIFSNNTEPENVKFFYRVERYVRDLGVTDDIMSNLSSTGYRMSLSVYLHVDPEVTQILILPITLEASFDNEKINSNDNQDVYKRQVKMLLAEKIIEEERVSERTEREKHGPVSYTHLDVYKRQTIHDSKLRRLGVPKHVRIKEKLS